MSKNVTNTNGKDNKRYFRCPEELWDSFNKAINFEKKYKDKSDCLRSLMRIYIDSVHNDIIESAKPEIKELVKSYRNVYGTEALEKLLKELS